MYPAIFLKQVLPEEDSKNFLASYVLHMVSKIKCAPYGTKVLQLGYNIYSNAGAFYHACFLCQKISFGAPSCILERTL